MRRLGLFLVPGLAFLALYARSLPYEFAWQDHSEIEQGALVYPLNGLSQAFLQPLANVDFRLAGVRLPYYRPLQAIVVSGVHHVAGEQPAAYRAVSLAVGALTMVVFTAFAWLLLARRVGPALFAGLIAALPPRPRGLRLDRGDLRSARRPLRHALPALRLARPGRRADRAARAL